MNKIFKCGTGLACYLPKKELNYFDWDVGEDVMIYINEEQIIIKRLKRK